MAKRIERSASNNIKSNRSRSENFAQNRTDKDEALSKKISMKPSVLLSPVPAVMVSCYDKKLNKNNIITIAWTGVVSSNPPMVSISVRPNRFSYRILVESSEFVINIPSVNQLKELDYCGVVSGENVDKFEATGLTPRRATKVKASLIDECPVNLECKIVKRMELGTHTMFLAEVVAVHADGELMREKGRLALEKAKLLCYVHGHYYAVGRRLGKFGFSVEKKKTAAKRRTRIESDNKNSSTR